MACNRDIFTFTFTKLHGVTSQNREQFSSFLGYLMQFLLNGVRSVTAEGGDE
jgi:hypothetical protein